MTAPLCLLLVCFLLTESESVDSPPRRVKLFSVLFFPLCSLASAAHSRSLFLLPHRSSEPSHCGLTLPLRLCFPFLPSPIPFLKEKEEKLVREGTRKVETCLNVSEGLFLGNASKTQEIFWHFQIEKSSLKTTQIKYCYISFSQSINMIQ